MNTRNEFSVGDIFTYQKYTLKVELSENCACEGCVGFQRLGLCKKLPSCYQKKFIKLNSYRIRQEKKKKTEFKKWIKK